MLTPVNTCSPECYLSIRLFLKNEVSVNACLQQIGVDYKPTSLWKESCNAVLKALSYVDDLRLFIVKNLSSFLGTSHIV